MPRPADLSFELLLTFAQLMDCGGNAASTADRLNINQSSMSKRLRRLHTLLDQPWIFRDGKCWRPTDEGRRVLPAVRDLIGRYVQLKTFTEDGHIERPEVRFACGRQTVSRFVRRATRRFWVEHPNVRLRVSTLPTQNRVEGVANGALDLAMVAQDESRIRAMARRELFVETVFKDRLALVCPANRRWAGGLAKLPKYRVGPGAMVGFPLLLPAADAGVRILLDEALRKCNLLDKLEIRLEVSSWSTLLAYAADGMGVCVLSESAVPRTQKLVVRYLDPNVIPPYQAKIICRRDPDRPSQPDLSPAARDFYKALKHAAKRRWE